MPETEQNIGMPEFTVSEISNAIKVMVEETYSFVRIRGEISGMKFAPSGHLYLNLKDDAAVLSAVCWKGVVSRFQFKPEDGLEVICTGRLTTYPGQSKYQLVIEFMEHAGLGALMAILEKRKQKLAAEGLFDESRKRPLPFLPQTIGIVTSPTGAVIRDMLHRIEDRFPVHVLVWPVLVQGDKAAEQIVAAIRGFNEFGSDGKPPRPDLLIVARGGGSIEDLWAFNEEIVVRAVAESEIPLISAIGHETDFTLIDYAADLRAPTPTAAAEMALRVRSDLLFAVEDLGRRAKRYLVSMAEDKMALLNSLFRAMPKPTQMFDDKIQRLDNLVLRMAATFPNIIKMKEQKLGFIEKLLESYHYKRVLERGFAIARDVSGNVISMAKELEAGQILNLEFHDGSKKVFVDGSKPVVAKKKIDDKKQDSLF